ncbi:MAG: hypothetical protein ABI591_13995 [Kofleriaceae bacterium]
MAESTDDGAPIAKDAIDPALIRLSRTRAKIGVVTAAGLVFLCGYFLVRLNADRRFAGAGAEPERVGIADIVADKIGSDKFVKLEATELVMSHAIRASTNKAGLGLRVAPVRGTGEQLWVAMSGDGWEKPQLGAYSGRLRKLRDLPFAPSIVSYAKQHPRPVFATTQAVRTAFGTSKATSVTGDTVEIQDGDRVAFDTVDPNTMIIVATFGERLPTAAVWATALGKAGIVITTQHDANDYTIRFDVTGDSATITSKLQAANLWAPARLEPMTHHYETTWAKLRGSSPAGFVVDGATIPDPQIDLVGLYVAREIPNGAYALITDERPEDYWYVLPIEIGLLAIGLVFAWALVRAVKRDLLPTRA